jgi:hypothetical protein
MREEDEQNPGPLGVSGAANIKLAPVRLGSEIHRSIGVRID